jgi:hypothetical protein
VVKSDLAGGQLPSSLFGANAEWWALMVLAHNLNTAMKRLVVGKDRATKRMKALRFRLIGLPGRVVSYARKLIIRLRAGAEAPGPNAPRTRVGSAHPEPPRAQSTLAPVLWHPSSESRRPCRPHSKPFSKRDILALGEQVLGR